MKKLIAATLLIPCLGFAKSKTVNVDDFLEKLIKDVPVATNGGSAQAALDKMKENISGLCLGYNQKQIVQEIYDIQADVDYNDRIEYTITAQDKHDNNYEIAASPKGVVEHDGIYKTRTVTFMYLPRGANLAVTAKLEIDQLKCAVTDLTLFSEIAFDQVPAVIDEDNHEGSFEQVQQNVDQMCYGYTKEEAFKILDTFSEASEDLGFSLTFYDQHGSERSPIDVAGNYVKTEADKVMEFEMSTERENDESSFNTYHDTKTIVCKK